jgi:hypothetical protein
MGEPQAQRQTQQHWLGGSAGQHSLGAASQHEGQTTDQIGRGVIQPDPDALERWLRLVTQEPLQAVAFLLHSGKQSLNPDQRCLAPVNGETIVSSPRR